MAEKRQFLDVWIVETNTVYQEVPFEVVTDWLGQGRLLDDDKVKPSGTKDWVRIGDSPTFRPYSLSMREDEQPVDADEVEPSPAEDPHIDHARRHAEEEDEDVDMIPLIDVTLVLLIFFMMTATTVGAAAFVKTPEVPIADIVNDTTGVRIDIQPNTDKDGNVIPDSILYSVAEGNAPAAEDDKDIQSPETLLNRLKIILDRKTDKVTLTINAHKDLKAKVARTVMLGLRAEGFSKKIADNFFGVSQRDEP